MHLLSGHPGVGALRLDPEALPLLLVTGEGRIEVPPDTALVTLGFTARAEGAAAAYNQVAAALSRVVAALLAAEIPREQLQTARISLSPVYEKERLVGYEATGTLQVTLQDMEAVGPVIDRAVEAGANQILGITFAVRDQTPYEAKALTAAVQDARREAAVLAQSLGIRLGPVWRVVAEPSPGPVIPVARLALGEAAMPILPGTLPLSRSVRVEYLIQQR